MTSEIAIITADAIALAADSAITIDKKRVWTSADKIFSLAPMNDIGIMIFGNGSFLGMSWDTVIKEFKHANGIKKFKKVNDCAEAFFHFISHLNISPCLEYMFVSDRLLELLDKLNDCIIFETNANISKTRKIVNFTIDLAINDVKNLEEIECKQNLKKFIKFYSLRIEKILHKDPKYKFLANKIINKPLKNKIYKLLNKISNSTYSSDWFKGIVICGYGGDELFPVLLEYILDGRLCGHNRVYINRSANLNKKMQPDAIVVPFAQADTTKMFMEGICPDVVAFVESQLEKHLKDKTQHFIEQCAHEGNRPVEREREEKSNAKIMKSFKKEFASFRMSAIAKPILNGIQNLPKEEMASTAEILVKMTALKRKLDSDLKSVSDPVDVALISKSDGFIWIKKKCYFPIELNPDFGVRERQIFNKSKY